MEFKNCLTNFILAYPAASLPLDLGPLVFDDSVKKKSNIFKNFVNLHLTDPDPGRPKSQ
jgi:hypothetical protein